MKAYEGLNQTDLKVIRMALEKLPITGADAMMMVDLQRKVQMEIDLLEIPKSKRPKKGDIITKE